MNPLSASDLETLSQRLRAMKNRAVGEIREASNDMAASLEQNDNEVQDTADTAENKRMEEVRRAEIEIDQTALVEIEQAEQRIANGTYGRCADCDDAIPRERLFAQPTALRCIACQTAAEKQQGGG